MADIPDSTSRPPRRRIFWAWVVLLLVLASVGIWWALRGSIHAQPSGGVSGKSAPGDASGKGAAGQSGQKGKKGGSGGGPQAVPVSAAKAYRGDIPVYQTGLGSVAAFYTVTVRTRVDGQLMDVFVREGDFVKKDVLLAQIDPRPFQVQLDQAEGQMARDQALLTNARLDLQRYQTLIQQEAIPKQQLDTQVSTVAQSVGNVKTDQAAID